MALTKIQVIVIYSDSDLFQPYLHIYIYLQCKQYDIAGRCTIVDKSLRLKTWNHTAQL